MTDRASPPPTQLLVYGFGPKADFEGRVLGALERIESGGALRILEALFVGSDADTGELVAADLRGGGAGGMVAPLLSFRLDPSERRRATERALQARPDSALGEALRELAGALEPGAAVVAVLVEHVWAGALERAVSASGGRRLASEYVGATDLGELASELVAAASRDAGSAPDES